MLKKGFCILLVLTLTLSVVPLSFAELYSENESKTITGMRMQPLLNKYNSLTSSEIQAQIDKYIDIQGHFGKDYVARLAALNVIAGDGISKFNPNDTLLACHYLKMLVMALGYTPEIPYGQPYWLPFVNIALEEGIIKQGEIADYTQPLSRELAGVIGFRTLMKYKEHTTGDDIWFDYNRSKINDYAYITDQYKNDVVMAYRMGIIQGYNNIYEPKGTLTRAQGAIIVNKLIDDNIRKESVPQPEEIIAYKTRTDINEALFDYRVKAGKTYTIYPGYFPLNEIYDVFKTMYRNINQFKGHQELLYSGLNDNIAVWQYETKEQADRFFTQNSSILTHYASFSVDLNKCFEKDRLNNNSDGFLYSINVYNFSAYNEQMKLYTQKLFKVLFEDEAEEAIKLHDYYLDIALNAKPRDWNVYMINNRQVHFFGSAGGFGIEIWAKGAIQRENMFKK